MGQSRWWRFACLTVLAVALLGAMSACGGGGGDEEDNYDFSGTWVMTSVIVQSNLPGFPAGQSGSDVARITQSGTSISLAVEEVAVQNGTCDPKAGTFSVSGADGPLAISTNGTRVDGDTMSGGWTMTGGTVFVRATHTMQLSSRNRAAGASGARGGFAAALLRSRR